MRVSDSPNLKLPRIKYIPKSLRVFTGKLEMRLRSKNNYRDRIRFINWIDSKSLPGIIPKSRLDIPENIIWQYWHEGLDAAPEIIRICIQSVRKNIGNHSHIVLSDEDVFNYIGLPEHIKNKWSLINPTKRSNIIRLALLSLYGGVWIDSTCFLTREVPERFINADFFAFSNSSDDRLIRTWFLCGKKNNPIINFWLRMHYKFYQYYTAPPCYFFFQYMFENMVTLEGSIRKEWINLKTDNADLSDRGLINSILSLSEKEAYVSMLSRSWIHKLSWRLEPAQTQVFKEII